MPLHMLASLFPASGEWTFALILAALGVAGAAWKYVIRPAARGPARELRTWHERAGGDFGGESFSGAESDFRRS